MLDLDWALPIKVQEAFQLPFHTTAKGHAVVYAPWCPLAWPKSGQLRRSHYVLWTMGVEIPSGHLVHHEDGVKLNDHPSNLRIISHGEHSRHHALTRSPDTLRRMSEAQLGHAVSEKTRRKISLAGMGKANASGKRTGQALDNVRRAVVERERKRYEQDLPLIKQVQAMYGRFSTHGIARELGISKDRVCRLLRVKIEEAT